MKDNVYSSKGKVSVIIANYNGQDILWDCLDSLENQDYKSKEIIVVDNKSTDRSKEVCQEFKVLFLEQTDNFGLARSYNRGAKQATGDYLFCINNDMRFQKECISELIKAINSDDIFAADPLQYDWEGNKVIHGATRICRDFRFLNFPLPFIRVDFSWVPNRIVDVPWGCAGALMLDRQKFERLGGFDNSFFLNYEDLDICTRAWMQGWRTIFVPSAIVYHKRQGYATGSLQRKKEISKVIFSNEKNTQRFVLKTMGLREVLLNLCNRIAHLMIAIYKRKLFLAWNIIYSSWINLTEIKDILKVRKAIFEQTKLNGWQVLKRFLRKNNISKYHLHN